MPKKIRFCRGNASEPQRRLNRTFIWDSFDSEDKGGLDGNLYAVVRILRSKSQKTKETKLARRVRQVRRMIITNSKTSDYYARTFVENSCHQVIASLGDKMQAVPETQETVYLLGQLVALKSCEMAKNAAEKGLTAAAGAIRAIGHLSVDFTISKNGEVRASVKKKRNRKKKTASTSAKKSSKKSSNASAEQGDDGVEMDNPTVIETKNGTKIIIGHLNIYLKLDNVQQLNMNPQIVQNILEEKLDNIIDNKIRK